MRPFGWFFNKHLLHHGEEAVAACGGEVAAEAYLVDEMEVGVEYFVGCVRVEDADEQRYDAFYDDGVGIGPEVHAPFPVDVGVEPYAALAAFDEAVGCLELVGQRSQGVAEVDDVAVAVHPVLDVGEFCDYFLLALFYGHFSL